MLDKIKLENLSTEKLLQLDEALASYIFKQPQGEPIHPSYKKNRKSYQLLIKQQVRLERIVRNFRKNQLKNIHSLVNMHLITAADVSFAPSPKLEQYINNPFWDESSTAYANALSDAIYPIYDNGAKTTGEDLGVGTQVSSSSAKSAKSLSKYVVNLADDLNKTTKKDIAQAISTSLQLKETRDELTARINDILDDPYRSEMIAQTESIRAFTQGRLDTLESIGYDQKQWQWPGNSDCPICSALDGEAVNIGDQFDTGSDSLGSVDGPPAHPWCQCGIKGVKSDDNVTGSEVKGGWVTENGQHEFWNGPEDRNDLEKEAIAAYGLTDNVKDAGFMTTDGKLIAKSADSHDVMAESLKNSPSLREYMKQSQNIRVTFDLMDNASYLETVTKPTLSQMKALREFTSGQQLVWDFTPSLGALNPTGGGGTFEDFRNAVDTHFAPVKAGDFITISRGGKSWVIPISDLGESATNRMDFSKPTQVPADGSFNRDHAEHMIKYNAALQAEQDRQHDQSIPANIKDLIYNAPVGGNVSPIRMAAHMLESLPGDLANNISLQHTLGQWGKSTEMIWKSKNDIQNMKM